MKKAGLLGRLLLGVACLLLLATWVVVSLEQSAQRARQVEREGQRLWQGLNLVAPRLTWSLENPEQLQAELKELSRELSAQLVLLDPSGLLIGDSAEDGGRPGRWVEQVRQGSRWVLWQPPGRAAKLVAWLPLSYAAGHRLVGLAPLPKVAEGGDWVVGAILAVLLLFALFALWLWQELEPLRILGQGAQRMAAGELEYRLLPGNWKEAETLAFALNGLAHEAQARLNQAERERSALEALFEGVEEGFLLFDPKGRLIRLNQAAKKTLSIHSVEPVGKELLELVRLPQLSELCHRLEERGENQSMEISLRQPEQRLEVEAIKLEFLEESGILLVVHDRTKLHRLEQLRKEFVANVSHELKTPITSIQGFAETLLGGAIEDKAHRRRFVEIIFNHSKRLSAIIEDLLALTRVEETIMAGSLAKQNTLLLPLLEGSIELVKLQAEKKGCRFELDCPTGFSLEINAQLVGQCLVNLLDNAVKYSPENTLVCLRVRLDPSGVFIEVEDQGEGVPFAEREKIFARFYRIDKSRSRMTGGTGLGLSIVKNIMSLHGGKVGVQGRQGPGSLFFLQFPALHPSLSGAEN